MKNAIKTALDQAKTYQAAGEVCFKKGELELAAQHLHQSVLLAPNIASTQYQFGFLLSLLGRTQQAHLHLDQAISLNRNYVEAYHQKAWLYKEQKQYQQALGYFNLALTLQPNDENIYVNIGNTLQAMEKFEFALAHHDFALSLNPNHIDALNGRAIAQASLNDDEEALNTYKQALHLNPQSCITLLNQSTLLNKMGRKIEAIQNLEQCVEIEPQNTLALCNLGKLHHDALNVNAAKACYLKALDQSPNDKLTQWNLAQLYLQLGFFEEGWKYYESGREAVPALRLQHKHYSQPLWTGECSIQDKRILLHAEQGFGDTIQFVRYAKLVRNLGAKVILGVPKPLISLIKTMSPEFKVIENSKDCAFDFHCPLMRLPLALKTNLESIPAEIPYLFADTLKTNAFAKKENTLNIGLVWSGSNTHANDLNRSIALEKLQPIFNLNASFHCLQKEIRDSDLALIKTLPQLHTYTEQLHDFSDTAALIETMDLVISVDTSVAHLAGAMGKPVWILLPSPPDWRWLLTREDSPWYPSARLFRQNQSATWDNVVMKLVSKLGQLIDKKCLK